MQVLKHVDLVGTTERSPQVLIALQQALGLKAFPLESKV